MKQWIKELDVIELRKQLNIHVNKLRTANEQIKALQIQITGLKLAVECGEKYGIEILKLETQNKELLEKNTKLVRELIDVNTANAHLRELAKTNLAG